MTETPNSASAACCASVWQALRIMLQLPDLLGEFLLPFSLPFRIELRFGFRFRLLSTVSPSLLSLSSTVLPLGQWTLAGLLPKISLRLRQSLATLVCTGWWHHGTGLGLRLDTA